MKAIILAAGYGERMGKLMNYLPKSLIPIVNKPILEHLIETLIQCRIQEIIIVVGHLKNQITSFLMKFQERKVTLIIKTANDFSKGPIYSFSACMDEIENEDFILLPADIMIDQPLLSDLLQRSSNQEIAFAFDDRESRMQHSAVYVSKDNEIRRVLGINSNIVGGASEVKLLLPLLICHTNFQPFVELGLRAKKTRVIDAVQFYLQNDNLASAFKIKRGTWFDLDTIQDFLIANKYYISQITKDHRLSKKLDDHMSHGILFNAPIFVGENCQIESDCIIGPYVSIGDETRIGHNVKIQNAIVISSSNIPSNSTIKNAIFFKSIAYYS